MFVLAFIRYCLDSDSWRETGKVGERRGGRAAKGPGWDQTLSLSYMVHTAPGELQGRPQVQFFMMNGVTQEESSNMFLLFTGKEKRGTFI